MRYFLRCAITATCWFGASAFILISTAQAMSFEQAWQQVLQHNDSLAADKANLARSEALRDAATDLYYPKIDLSGSYTRLEKPVALDLKDLEPLASLDPSTLDPVLAQILGPLLQLPTTTNFTEQNITTSSIRAIWPLYLGGRRGAAIDIAREQHIEAAKILAMRQQAKFEDLARVYFGVVLTTQVAQTYQEVEDGLAKHRRNAMKLEQQGQIALVERLQADASYDKAKVDTKKALRNYQIAQLALSKLLHQDTAIQPATKLFTEPRIPALAAFMSKTLSSYPGLAILDSKAEQAKNMQIIAKSLYQPEVYMFGNYQLYEGDSLAAKVSPDWMVGLGVSVPLVDNSGRSGKVQAAHSNLVQIHYLHAQAERDLSLLVEKTYREAEQALEEYQGLESSLALAQENLRIRLKAFSQGLATSLDVVDAELFQAKVKTQRQSAAYNHVIALAKLTALSGEMDRFSQYYRFN
ncbi:TolC family protein [Agarivorans sp. Z349TD_8]|uniref:TolC family protein n=1 Tax=Agarivorans sp. Z349TD_8 TaxID=3421434 RepID=UPI003D7CA6D3